MRRLLRITLLLVLALLILAVGAVTWLIHDEALLRAQLSRLVLAQTGRELRIEHPLELSLGRLSTLEAGGIHLANAGWADTPYMIRIGRLKVSVDVPSLFGGPARIPSLEIADCAVELLRNDAGEANWAPFGAGDEPRPNRDQAATLPRIKRLAIDNCSVVLDEPDRARALEIGITEARLVRDDAGRVEGHVDGLLDGESLAVRGWLEPVSAFQSGGTLRHELELRAGPVTLESAGSVADALAFSEPDISTRFTGPAIERILEQYALPPVSAGPFDFRVTLATRDGRAVIDVDGDLGSLDVDANGELDALRRPREGHVQSSASGDDLAAIALAFGLELPVAGAFDWKADVRFGADRVEIVSASLKTADETFAVSGTLSTRPRLAGSALELSIESSEAGRWLSLAGQAERPIGPLSVAGMVRVDERGQLGIDATARHADGTLEAHGGLGPVNGPYVPDLDVHYESANAAHLAALAGLTSFPARPVRLQGHLRQQGRTVSVQGLEAWLDRHHLAADGTLVLARNLEGSELDLTLEIPDLAELGALFGRPGLPQEALRLDARLWPDGPGLGFDVGKAEMGRIRLALEGKIADLERPGGIDARFDLRFPDTSILGALLPGVEFPPGAVHATGALNRRGDRTHLENVSATLGETRLQLGGDFSPQWDLALQARVTGPDMSALDGLARVSLPPRPFDASATLHGTPTALDFRDLRVTAGRSDVRGVLSIRRGERLRVETNLEGAYLNLNHWIGPGQDGESAAPAEAPRYVFDDTPVLTLGDLGVDLDATIRVDELELGFGRYTDLATRVVLTDQRLAVDPFAIEGLNEGQVKGWARLDRAGPVPRLDIEVSGVDTRLTMGAAEGQDLGTLPLGNYRIELHGLGATRREMASSLDGRFRADFGAGRLALLRGAFLFSDFFAELINTLNPFTETQEFTELECAVVAADIESGQVAVGPAVFHAQKVTVLTQGQIDLGTEEIDLTFNSKQRKGLGISATDLVNPFIKVGGTLAKPSLQLDPAGTVVKGGIAVATAGLSILANSLAERFLSSKDPCGDALKTIREREAGKR